MKVLLVLCALLSVSYAWDTEDLEIFDLYEEVNGTFYELIGVPQNAETSEIRRAYRKRSKELHPDKNKAENAEEMFRQLAAVYDILKNKERREKYETVLRDGLPDWRQPIYYYRKYRKMGILELSILVSLIATIGHYLTWWVAYLEKYYEMDERLAPERKKREKKKAKGEKVEDLVVDEVMEQETGYRRPGKWDFLPFVLCRVTKRCVLSVPAYIRYLKEKREYDEEVRKEEEEEEKEAAERAAIPKKPKKVKVPKVIRDASEFEHEGAWVMPTLPQDGNDSSSEKPKEIKKSAWTEEDFAALAKAMAKYPGGTPGRWQRIAHDLGRSPGDITKKVKEMKQNITANLPSQSAQAGTETLITTKKLDINLSDTIITKAIDSELGKTDINTGNNFYDSQYDIPDDYDQGVSYNNEEPEEDYTATKRKNKVKTRPIAEKTEENSTEANNKTENETNKKDEIKEVNQKDTTEQSPPANATAVGSDFWTQIQQKCLEAAIQQFPKTTSERWTCIARAVPGKTKEQCIARFKLIAAQVIQRKSKQAKGS